MITNQDLENWFTYHPPKDSDLTKYAAIRGAAKFFAKVILEVTPEGPDQSAAIRKLREVVMTANQSIACSS